MVMMMLAVMMIMSVMIMVVVMMIVVMMIVVIMVVAMIVMIMIVMMIVEVDVEMNGGNPVLRYVIDIYRVMIVEGELFEFGNQMSGGHTQLKARAQKHIAAYSGEAVKIYRIQISHSSYCLNFSPSMVMSSD